MIAQPTMTPIDSNPISFQDPFTCLKGGYDIHVHFDMERHALALSVYEAFLSYLANHHIRPTFSFFYDKPPDFEGGPHKGPMWTVQLMGINPARDVMQEGGNEKAVQQFGVAVAWLMLNRQGLKVLVHPNVAMPFGDVETEILDHSERTMWMGVADPVPVLLDLEFFNQLLKKGSKDAEAEAIKRLENATPSSEAV